MTPPTKRRDRLESWKRRLLGAPVERTAFREKELAAADRAKSAAFARSLALYRSDSFEFASRELAGASHLVASRTGLYAVNRHEWSLLASGCFFGMTLRGGDIFLFEAAAKRHVREPLGRVLKLSHDGSRLTHTAVMAKGLDNDCHGIDFLDGNLHVCDTYHQQVLRFAPGEQTYEVLSPLDACAQGKADPQYAHVNTLLHTGDSILLLLHNLSTTTGRASEIAAFDPEWRPRKRWAVAGRDCHGLALLEDGTLLICDSQAGDLITDGGLRVKVSPHITRGLAVGHDSIAVGGSFVAYRENRFSTGGTVTFLDRRYRIENVLNVPCSPTEVRRLDGQDCSLSGYLQTRGTQPVPAS